MAKLSRKRVKAIFYWEDSLENSVLRRYWFNLGESRGLDFKRGVVTDRIGYLLPLILQIVGRTIPCIFTAETNSFLQCVSWRNTLKKLLNLSRFSVISRLSFHNHLLRLVPLNDISWSVYKHVFFVISQPNIEIFLKILFTG